MFCCTLLYVHFSIAIILMGKRELIALLNLSSWCLVMVERLFLTVPWGCLQFVIVVFPDHTHLLFLLLNVCNHFSIAIILMGKRELIALLNLSSWCLVMVERLFLTVPRGCLQFVIVVFPNHTHLLFWTPPPEKTHTQSYRFPYEYWYGPPGKSQSYPASIPALASHRHRSKVQNYNASSFILANDGLMLFCIVTPR